MKLGLGLIVRNEEHDLPRCLNTFLPQFDCVAIVDTGSTDRTMEIAREIIAQHPHLTESYVGQNLSYSDDNGRLCDFGQARNLYVKILEAWGCDFSMSCDADDSFIGPSDLKKYLEENGADIFNLKYHLNDHHYILSFKIWRTALGCRYVGRVHEYLHFDWNNKFDNSGGIEIRHHVGHHEGQEHGTERNLRILRQEIYPPLRTLFYYANENVDAQNYPEAIKWYIEYIRRVQMGEPTWDVELAHCYWRAARWLQHLGKTAEAEALSHELLKRDPSWSESWCELAYIAQCRGDIESVRKYALRALENKWESRLFSESDKYTTTPANMLVYCNMIEMSQNKK